MTVLFSAVSGVNQTDGSAANSAGGWVSGSLANLAISTLATVIFDLGSGWRTIRSLVVSGANMTASTGTTVSATFSADAVGTDALPGMTPNTVSGGFTYTGTSVGLAFQLLVTGRYVRISFTNGSSAAQGATAKLVITGLDT